MVHGSALNRPFSLTQGKPQQEIIDAFNPADLIYKVKPVYDVAQGSKTSFNPFLDTIATTTFTNSSATILMSGDATGGVGGNLVVPTSNDIPMLIANEDTLIMYSAGTDTQFDRQYLIRPRVAAAISRFFLSCAFAMNVSAYTSGNYLFDSVRVIIYKVAGENTAGFKIISDKTLTTGHVNLAATGTQVFIVRDLITSDLIRESDTLIFRFIMNVSVGVGDRQEGIVPFFSFSSSNNPKVYSVSGYELNVKPRLNDSETVFRDDTQNYRADMSGIPQPAL